MILSGGTTPPRRAAVRSCWLHSDKAIFHFEGSDSISAAEELAGLEVQVSIEERLPVPAGSYYVTDLVGCEVWEAGGKKIGAVRDVLIPGEKTKGTPLLAVDTPTGELLVPLSVDICVFIEPASRRIEIRPPEGLLDLNRETKKDA